MTNISVPTPIPSQKPLKPFPARRLPKGMTNASDSELEKSIESCERWEWFGGGLVVVGVLGEVAIAAIHPPYDSFLEQWGSSLANSLVALGVGLEIILGQMAGRRQSELKRRSDERVGAANVRAEEANQKAQEAALELARLTTPRAQLLTPEATISIIEAIRPFSGTPFTIGLPPVGREQWDLAWHLEPILPKAGWVFIDWILGPGIRKISPTTMQPWSYGLANVSNVTIEFLPMFADEMTPPAKALVDALNSIGIAAKIEPNPVSGISGRGNAIHLLIGAKE